MSAPEQDATRIRQERVRRRNGIVWIDFGDGPITPWEQLTAEILANEARRERR